MHLLAFDAETGGMQFEPVLVRVIMATPTLLGQLDDDLETATLDHVGEHGP
jgi:hypothetical protein